MPPSRAPVFTSVTIALVFCATGSRAVTASPSPTPGSCSLPADFTCSSAGGYVAHVSQRSTGALNVTSTPAVLTAVGVYADAFLWNLTVVTASSSAFWQGTIAPACTSVTFTNGEVWLLVATPTPSPTQTQTRTQSTSRSQSRTPTVTTGLTVTITPTQSTTRSFSATQTMTQSGSRSQLETRSSSASQSASGSTSATASQSLSPSESPSNSASQSVSPSQSPSQRQTSSRSSTASRTSSRTQTASVSPSNPPLPAPKYDPQTTTTAGALLGVSVLVAAAVAVTLCLCTSASKMESAAQRAASEAAAELREQADADDETYARRASMVQPSFDAEGVDPSGGSSGTVAARRQSAAGHMNARITPVNADLAPASSTDSATLSVANAAIGLNVGGGPVRGHRAGGPRRDNPWVGGGGGSSVVGTEDGSVWTGSLDNYQQPQYHQQQGRRVSGGAPIGRGDSGGSAVHTLPTDADIDDIVGTTR